MANNKMKSLPPAKPEPQPESVTFTQSLNRPIFGMVKKYKDDKGLTSEQDVVRLAVAFFLEHTGYKKAY